MSKQLWVDAFDEKYSELIDTGLSMAEVERQCIEYADGALERAIDNADRLRKARRESE